MKKVQAWEYLNNPEYCSQLKMVDYYNLLLKAGYNKKDAQKLANNRGWQRLQAGVTM